MELSEIEPSRKGTFLNMTQKQLAINVKMLLHLLGQPLLANTLIISIKQELH